MGKITESPDLYASIFEEEEFVLFHLSPKSDEGKELIKEITNSESFREALNNAKAVIEKKGKEEYQAMLEIEGPTQKISLDLKTLTRSAFTNHERSRLLAHSAP